VRVREYTHTPATPERVIQSVEIQRSTDGGETWRDMPLRLSPWARLKCTLLEGGWPPQACRRLSCDRGIIELEFENPDYWDNWPLKIWRATHDPRFGWWSLRVVRA
jgi:hypothetical protein